VGNIEIMSNLAAGQQELTGKLEVAAHDLDGSVLAVELVLNNGMKLLVADNPKGEALLRAAGQKVRINGEVSFECFGLMVTVESYCIL